MSAKGTTSQQLLADGAQLMVDLLDRGMRLSTDAVDAVRERTRGPFELPSLPTSSCGCDIPPPCWYPKSAGQVTSHVCPGGTAVLRIRVTNCGPTARTIQVEAEKPMKADPEALQLGPMERGVVTVSLPIPTDQAAESGREYLVWIHGCHDHFIRWTIDTDKRGADSCHELDVEDCPDYLHHWYDHFYCAHPCPGGRRLQPRG
jgi:hypothetical protein